MAMYRCGGGSGVTPTSITPSDSSPVEMTTGNAYGVTKTGYAIESQPSSKTPDDTTPPTVTEGEIVKMGGSGYLYATQQSEIETTLWTNSNVHSSFSQQDITLSDDFTNYKNIKIIFFRIFSDLTTPHAEEWLVSEMNNWVVYNGQFSSDNTQGVFGVYIGSEFVYRQVRRQSADSTKKLYITNPYKLNATGTVESVYLIPARIIGVK